jgi:CYTH domain-containing protein
MPQLPAGAERVGIEQGYLPESGARLRRVTGADGTVRCWLTIKRGTGLVREETERRLDPDEFERDWPRTVGARIRKTRHRVPDGGLRWEIDEFLDRDLVLAEVELPAPDTPVAPPAWLAGAMIREVTEDPRYANVALARAGGVPA